MCHCGLILFLVWLNKIKTRIYNGQFETLFHIETNVVTWMCRPFHVLFLQISIMKIKTCMYFV